VLGRSLDREGGHVARRRRLAEHALPRDRPRHALPLPARLDLAPRTATICLVDLASEVVLGCIRQLRPECDAAMKAGDWTAYGEADAKLQAALNKALAAQGQ
jgi:hypothetical protein